MFSWSWINYPSMFSMKKKEKWGGKKYYGSPTRTRINIPNWILYFNVLIPSRHIFPLYRIAQGHIEHIAGTDRTCPMKEINGSQNDAPNFLTSLTNTEGLTSEHIVGLVTDLFSAGIDSVSLQLFVSLKLKRRFQEVPYVMTSLLLHLS